MSGRIRNLSIFDKKSSHRRHNIKTHRNSNENFDDRSSCKTMLAKHAWNDARFNTYLFVHKRDALLSDVGALCCRGTLGMYWASKPSPGRRRRDALKENRALLQDMDRKPPCALTSLRGFYLREFYLDIFTR